MKHIRVTALFLALLLLFSACGAPDAPVTAPAGTEAGTEAETEPETTRNIDRTAEEIYLAHPELTPVDYDSPALLPKTEDAGMDYVDRLTFLCDSPTYWLRLYELLSGGYSTTQVWTGPEGTMTLAYLRGFRILDPIDGVERTIPEAVEKHKPPVIVIALGVNGIAFMDQESFTEEYSHLIGEIRAASPETEILLQSIYPISPKFSNWGSITNAKITAANRWILRMAEKFGLHYIDAFSCLVGEDGNILPELVMKDGLHPNKEGLTRVLAYIRTHAYLPDGE